MTLRLWTVAYKARQTSCVIYLTIMCLSLIASRPDIKEYCQWENFTASCRPGLEVIRMRQARYGRMRFGRCMQEDHGSVGCSADVLPHLSARCSGRQSCHLIIPDSQLHQVHPCPRELVPYLEADYECIKVERFKSFNDSSSVQSDDVNKITCHDDSQIVDVIRSGHVSSMTSLITSAGSQICPWILRAEPGQTLNLTLIVFPIVQYSIVHDTSLGFEGGINCPWKISVQKKNESKIAARCIDELSYSDSDWTMLREINEDRAVASKYRLSSSSNELKVFLYPTHQQYEKHLGYYPAFLLKFEALGCADLGDILYADVTRDGDAVSVSCRATGETYFLTCIEFHWVGELQNCSEPIRRTMASYLSSKSFPIGVLLMIGVCVALFVTSSVLLIFGLIRLFHRPNRIERKNQTCGTTDMLLGNSTTADMEEDIQTDQQTYTGTSIQQYPTYLSHLLHPPSLTLHSLTSANDITMTSWSNQTTSDVISKPLRCSVDSSTSGQVLANLSLCHFHYNSIMSMRQEDFGDTQVGNFQSLEAFQTTALDKQCENADVPHLNPCVQGSNDLVDGSIFNITEHSDNQENYLDHPDQNSAEKVNFSENILRNMQQKRITKSHKNLELLDIAKHSDPGVDPPLGKDKATVRNSDGLVINISVGIEKNRMGRSISYDPGLVCNNDKLSTQELPKIQNGIRIDKDTVTYTAK